MSVQFDKIINPGASIQTAETTQGIGTYYIKRGTYNLDSTITFDQNNCKIEFAPGVVINANTGGLVLSGNNIEVVGGPVTIDNNSSADASALTVSGSACHISLRNGSVIGNIITTSAADGFFLDGGGWGTVIESIDCAATDAIVQYSAWNSKLSAAAKIAIDVNGGSGRNIIQFNKIIDSDAVGILIVDPDCLVLGNTVLDADGIGIAIREARCRVLGNSIFSSVVGDDIDVTASGDNSIIAANHCVGLIDIDGSAENLVIVGNKAGNIEDDSGTSTTMFNDVGFASCAVTGTLQSSGALESEIVLGGKTLILTLTDASWRNLPAADLATAFQALLTGDHSEANDWDNEKSTILASGTVVRTSETVMTITLAMAATYSITATDEIVTLANLDSTVLETESTITPDDTSYTITEGS
jgi:hypothetical protein